MLKKNSLSNNWVDTLIALSDLIISELSPDISTDSENMNICQFVVSLIKIHTEPKFQDMLIYK